MSDAETETTTRPSPGFYRHRIGGAMLTTLLDGQFEASFGLVVGIDAAEAERLERAAFRRSPPRLTVNAFLLEAGGRRILIDSGIGNAYGPSMGHTARHLEAAGVTPAQIDTILITHGHIDHVNGLLDDAGAPLYLNAELFINAAEWAFWTDDTLRAGAPDDRKQAIDTARRALAPYRERMHTFDGSSVIPGVTAVPEPGHTPGHTGYLIEDGGERLLIWADIVHLPGIQFARPEAGVMFDTDGAQAIKTRQRILDMAATDRLAIAGMHLDFPAVGHVDRSGSGYVLVPESWTELA